MNSYPQSTRRGRLNEPWWVVTLLVAMALITLLLILVVPLVVVFSYAFSQGIEAFFNALLDSHALHALQLTLFVAIVAVVFNALFGLAAAWTIARFRFRGRQLLLSILDLPFAISPVIAGLLFILVYGIHGIFSPILNQLDLQIIFAVPGVILATIFVTMPFIARELIPLMEEQGQVEEEAALTIGASGWQMFCHITLPKIKWGLFYGMVLTNARAMGEFGAVSVVSGHLRGETNTLPLHIEILYNEFHTQAAFACAALLACLALLTLFIKTIIEQRREH